MVNNKGFTLIELMIVVAIIGILAAIVYPSYQSYALESKRTDMMAELQNIGQLIETKKIEKRNYSNINVSDVLASPTFPKTGTPLYDLSITPSTNGKLVNGNWTITATPITTGTMKSDGNLTLNSTGNKCRGTTTPKCGTGQEWKQ